MKITNIGHITFQMKNEEAMLHFYGEILGMKRLFTLTTGELCEFIEAEAGEAAAEMTKELRAGGDQPWITYMKLADHQYLELFYGMGKTYEEFGDREPYYGYRKVNYEVDDIEVLRERLVGAGVALKDDIHTTVDGSREIAVYDPDGNEIQFTEYPKGDQACLTMPKDYRKTCSAVRFTTQAAFQIQDAAGMERFYCEGLGLKKVMTLTWGDLCSWLEEKGITDADRLESLKKMADQPWIDYIEVAPHQYIEFFHSPEQKQERRDLVPYYGYQHICLEVEDIQAAWDAIHQNGLTPDTELRLGPDGACQFWLVDPDGNRIELMQYMDGAKQLME